ncbi:MAG: CPXCG motif-containing cysteine-rich protein [Halobacteriovoraceae bacterium]|nr:CPXCG motif-containing cysteine-rich protein [Halobacteriovoraceae bacterium]MBT5094264.1 CPXCG motif-containing cysteine-rich protein [Halobacteriovoraceae bacterium]
MEGESENSFSCPYCMSPVSMLLETYHGKQEYIEDCEVCCRPIQINYSVSDGEIRHFEAKRLDD